MTRLSKVPAFLLALALAGCVSQTTVVQDKAAAGVASNNVQQATNNIGTAGAAPVANRAAPVPSLVSKTVLAGQTIEIIHLTNVNPDCTPGTVGTLRVTQQPVHGTATTAQSDVYPNFPAANPRSACNSKKVPGVMITYTPNPGFTGSDFMAVEAFTHSGGDSHEMKVDITVK